MKGRLKADPSFQCNACTENVMRISEDDPEMIIGNHKFVDSFYSLGDSIAQAVFHWSGR